MKLEDGLKKKLIKKKMIEGREKYNYRLKKFDIRADQFF